MAENLNTLEINETLEQLLSEGKSNHDKEFEHRYIECSYVEFIYQTVLRKHGAASFLAEEYYQD